MPESLDNGDYTIYTLGGNLDEYSTTATSEFNPYAAGAKFSL